MNNDQFFRRFCYPNGCLKNKLKVHDAQRLAAKEFQTVCQQIQLILTQAPRITNLDDLCTVHKRLLGTIYTWAGQVRTDYDLHKRTDGMDFYAQPAATIPLAWQYIEHDLLQPVIGEKQPSIERYVELLDNINTLHPFREGNGRATKTFLQLLARQHHQYLYFPRHQKQLIVAMNAANYKKMAEQVQLVPINQPVTRPSAEPPFDDQKLTICQHQFKDQLAYRTARDSVLFNLYEGWRPSSAEVLAILE
ncbi:Fic/DOC family protein [Limosilactobacillus panis]|uniref:protein adenylyltransferase n=1 Tax=Limosilactobacillus panis DSM 6035 TaxID=1423782 RepID=A0A0R1X9H8_9LACO|nr:Fic family protein [Limosilactobacillus panis]KRM26879.1 hypothetical protein FD32_GL000207 [Limosilactobacillus panis DSM 6035]